MPLPLMARLGGTRTLPLPLMARLGGTHTLPLPLITRFDGTCEYNVRKGRFCIIVAIMLG